jgi:Domain of unknown function (DUF1707)/Cell wall-active antibiotics response 4TMS YvqF
MHPEPFNSNSRLRASDADREVAAEVLSTALAEGRLSVAEHSERLDALYRVKTQAEIVPLLDDLPTKITAVTPARQADLAPGTGRRQNIIAIFGGSVRKGAWHAEPKITALTVFGGATLDFREAVLPQQEITLHATSIFGGVDIVVPPEMRVIDSGIAIFGGRETGSDGEESTDPNAPILRLTGLPSSAASA